MERGGGAIRMVLKKVISTNHKLLYQPKRTCKNSKKEREIKENNVLVISNNTRTYKQEKH